MEVIFSDWMKENNLWDFKTVKNATQFSDGPGSASGSEPLQDLPTSVPYLP